MLTDVAISMDDKFVSMIVGKNRDSTERRVRAVSYTHLDVYKRQVYESVSYDRWL